QLKKSFFKKDTFFFFFSLKIYIDMTNTPTPKEDQVSELPNNNLLFEKIAMKFYTNWSPPKRVVNEYRAEKIPVYDISNITYEIFVWYHLIPNQPCIIQNIKIKKKRNISNDWNITKDWLNPSTKTESLLNINYVKTKFGDATVTVANCGEKDYSDQKRTEMKLSEYMNYWESKQVNQKDIIPHIQKEVNNEQMQWIFDPQYTNNLLYCKDWHIQLYCKEKSIDNLFVTPKLFQDDWLNYYWDSISSHSKNNIDTNQINGNDDNKDYFNSGIYIHIY
ncbi:hypothetical protein RFI_36173, partial [Reticulomyxa filosa]